MKNCWQYFPPIKPGLLWDANIIFIVSPSNKAFKKWKPWGLLLEFYSALCFFFFFLYFLVCLPNYFNPFTLKIAQSQN